MFVKLMGVIILCAGGGMAGGAKALDLSKRVNRIRALYEAILIFKNEINFKTAPLCDAFESAAKRDISGVFEKSIPHIFEKGADKAFCDAVEDTFKDDEEKEILFSFSKGLTLPDKNGQLANADLALTKINVLHNKALEKRDKLFSLYCTVGILSGAAGGIILF